MIMLILLSCTSCGVKQSKDKQEAKKKITREGDYSYANSTDIEFVKSKFPNIEEIKAVSYIYEKKSNDSIGKTLLVVLVQILQTAGTKLAVKCDKRIQK